ncbi:TolB family protein [Saccharothrix australiensis]|uniref:WD40 repeat protein n=1 Tax=Saccharothrix australiensis TaxID=2072 RepID=A0A495W4X3_9PSEU|nr:PD40 domain-containing protein [Saccharothrix australiensis]RKT56097.1 WD40 repeat protein [Saccharothrix australiensis]
MSGLPVRARFAVTAAAALVLAGVAVGYTALSSGPGGDVVAGAVSGPRLQVLGNGRLSVVSRTDPSAPREVTDQRCDRAYAAGGTIACLRPVGPLKAGGLAVLDSSLRELRTVPLTGFPNRARVSASGRMVAWTLFVDGHSYAANGFSTSTGILDTRTGALVTSLEEFTSTVDGSVVTAADRNYWGVTFAADDNRFYATMSTGGHRYLVEGDFAARTVKALADDVECPSLSPDGTRIAFKAAVGGDPQRGWRLSTLDLATMAVTPSAEARSVDDQPAWLDDRTIAYGVQRGDGVNDVWVVPADGTGSPRVLVPEANSPAPL